jgi:hypothetical protein
MMYLSNFFYRVITKYHLIVAIALSCAFYAVVYSYNMEGQHITGKPMQVLDTQMWYGMDKVNEIIGGYPPLVKQKVVFFARVYDTLFPVIYVTIFISAITLLSGGMFNEHNKWRLLNLVPIAAGVLDLLENASIVTLIQYHPDITQAMVQKAAIFTLLKWCFIILCLFIIAGLGFMQYYRKKKTHI